ncbi:unnamed protein product [Victoria cruziana]
MWLFYLISLPLTLGMVCVTLRYFAGPDVPRYVLFTVGYAWFCSLSIIILVPADIWTTILGHDKGGMAFFWGWSYWSTFVLTWAVVPTIQGYEDAGDFSVKERVKSSIHANLVFYISVGSIGLFGVILLIAMHKMWSQGIVGLAMGCSNTFGLVTGAFLLGFGLSEIPKSIWWNADWVTRRKVLSHRVAKMAVNLDNAHQELSNAIAVAQATSKQMSKRDPLRPHMDVIDDMLHQMFREDPDFKPTGGRLEENDMDYDEDEKSMATLRRQLRIAREEYYRYKSEYTKYVTEALELDDTIKNYEHGDETRWKYVSSLRPARTGTVAPFLDTFEWIWRCILRKHLGKLVAVLLGCLSAAILLAEATLLPAVDLSLFSVLIKAVGKQEMLVQVVAFVPLMYMCICTYYSLFKIGMLMFYSLTPRQTSAVSLLMICSMVARYAPPISYNFLNLIRLGGDAKTTFEMRMGNIDDAVPFFGRGFNKIYPLIMVVYTLLVASNFFHKVVNLFGNWKRLRFQTDAEDMDGFDPSGVIILQKERSWLQRGSNVGVPLARNFDAVSEDIESGIVPAGSARNEVNSLTASLPRDGSIGSRARSSKNDSQGHKSRQEGIERKYAALKGQRQRDPEPSFSVPLLEAGNSRDEDSSRLMASSSSALSNTWASMKTNFQNLRSNLDAKGFLQLRQTRETKPKSSDPEQSLDEIFERITKNRDEEF